MAKYQIYLSLKRPRYHCVWTLSDKNRLKDFYNFRDRDYEYFDDFYPVFEQRFDYKEFTKYQDLVFKLDNVGLINRFLHNMENRLYRKRSANYYMKWGGKLASRIVQYVKSVEFTETLQIPPDFGIEHNLFNFHVWLIAQRLKDFREDVTLTSDQKDKAARIFEKGMILMISSYIQQKTAGVFIKKKNDYV